jgi:hypothetical protein
MSFILAAEEIASLEDDARLSRDPDITRFASVRSQCDALPLEPRVRALWSPAALARLQPEIDRAEAWARGFAENACRSLISRFGHLAEPD